MYVCETKKEEFQDSHQGNLSVSHYAARFIQLSRFASESITAEAKKAREFFKDLKADIFDRVATMKPTTYAETLENAQLVEELLTNRY